MQRVHCSPGRPSMACQRCRRRKIKCDLQTPRCGHCTKRGVDCVPGQRENGLTNRDHVQDLETRLAELKEKVSRLQTSPPVATVTGSNAIENPNGGTRNDFMTPISVSTMGFPENAPKQYRTLTLTRIVQVSLDTWTEQKLLPLKSEDVKRVSTLQVKEAHQLIGFYQHEIHILFPFLQLQNVERAIHNCISAGDPLSLDSISSMVLAIGALLQGSLSSRSFYRILALITSARRNMSILTEHNSIESLQLLLLLTLFSLFDAGGGSSWHLVGMATQVAISLGLHQIDSGGIFSVAAGTGLLEFWTTYILDRVIALSLEKPFGMADEDITTPMELPHIPEVRRLEKLLLRLRSLSGSRNDDHNQIALRMEHPETQYDCCRLFELFEFHLSTWSLGPPFPQLDITPARKHYSEYIRLAGTLMTEGFRLPWVISYSLIHSFLVSEFASLVVLQATSEDERVNVTQRQTLSSVLSALADHFPSLRPLIDLFEGRSIEKDQVPGLNAATVRLWESLTALQTR